MPSNPDVKKENILMNFLLTLREVGGTSGIGETTAKEFARHTVEPRVYLVGRNEVQASRILEELQKINPKGTNTFIKSDVSLLKNVDSACEEIKAKEEKVNLLCLTTGYLSLEGRNGKKTNCNSYYLLLMMSMMAKRNYGRP